MRAALSCYWCERSFRPRRSGGQAQRFCRPSYRRAFHATLRSWALDALAAGVLTLADIKNGPVAMRALLPGQEDGAVQQTDATASA
jgi:hypothetical protein